MAYKPRKKAQGERDLTATHQGPKPADFPVGSVESRAAARAMIHRPDGGCLPRPGDTIVEFDATPRSVALYRALCAPSPNMARVAAPADEPTTWFAFPKGFDPDSLPESEPPMSLSDVPDEVLFSVIEAPMKPPAERYVTIRDGAVVKTNQAVRATPSGSQGAENAG
jgi:hypothetical protein